MPVYRDGRLRDWLPVPGCRPYVARRMRLIDELHSQEVAFGLPMARVGGGGVARGTVLWARVEGKEQLARARKLRPYPSIVLQEGASTRRLLLWALERMVPYDHLVRANRRLAYACGATQKWGDPDVLRVPIPGTFLRVDRSRPVAVMVSRLEPAFYDVRQVVGRLKEPPPADAWLTRVKEGSA